MAYTNEQMANWNPITGQIENPSAPSGTTYSTPSTPTPIQNNSSSNYAPGSAAGPLTWQQQQQAQQSGQPAYIPPASGGGSVQPQPQPQPQNTDFMSVINGLKASIDQQQQALNQQVQNMQKSQSDYAKQQSQYQQQQQKQNDQQYNALKQNQQNQLLELRNIANEHNIPIGYENGQVTLNGKAVNPEQYGLQNVDGRYMGTSDQIAGLLGNTYGQNLVGVRSGLESQGHAVGYNNGQLSVNNIPVDSSGTINIGGHLYTTPEGLQNMQMRAGGQYPINTNAGGNTQQGTTVQPSKEQSDLQDLNTLVNEMAKMKPPEADTKTMVDLLKGLQEYKRPYDDQIKNLLASTMTKFDYNPDNDPLLKKAVDYADKKLLEEMNSRGILSSTMTVDNLAKVKEDLIPQYQQIAMDQYYKNLDTAFKQIGVMQQLNQDDYTQYYNMVSKSIDVLDKVNQSTIDTWKNTFTFMSDILGKKADLITKEANAKRDDMTIALNKINTLGYVDNETSLITGLPVGTPSYKAKQDILARYDEYNKMAIQAKDRKDEIKMQGENAIKEIEYKSQIKNKEDAQLASASNVDAQLMNVPASQAMDYVSKNATELLKQMGYAGYSKLVESISKRREKEIDNARQDERIQFQEGMANKRFELQESSADAREARAAAREERLASKQSASEKKDELNQSFGEDYSALKNMSVADAVRELKNGSAEYIKAYGLDGYKKLYNSVLSDAIAMGQAEEMK